MRTSLKATTALVLLGFFFTLYCALYVRGALDAGAISDPYIGCMTERDLARLNAGQDQQLADYWMRANIQLHQTDGGRSLGWHWHGLLTATGLALTTTAQERIAIAYPSMNQSHLCGAPSG